VRTEFDHIATLLGYPRPDYHERVRESLRLSDGAALEEFAAAIGSLSVTDLEELYTRVFDLNPDATLDIGWHLFGEEYARGEFLVYLRQQVRRYGVQETAELPDHLTQVLPLVARMPEEEAAEFETRFLMPALAKIAKAVGDTDNPYSKLIAALQQMLETKSNVEVLG
jgi:nitrate reductase delta subunit